MEQNEDIIQKLQNMADVPASRSLIPKVLAHLGLESEGVSPHTSIEALTLLLRHDLWQVRLSAIRRLRLLAEPKTDELLELALEDENEFVRMMAAQALEGRSRSVPLLQSKTGRVQNTSFSTDQKRETAKFIPTATKVPVEIFCSYAHQDEPHLRKLETHLSGIKRQGLISIWHDRQITPGTNWAQALDTHLETASIILLLVSADFLASDHCYDIEMQRALERHRRGEARVVPIILRPCDWQHTPLKDLQCFPRDGNPVTQQLYPDEVFHTIAQDIRRVIEKQKPLVPPPVPLSSQNRQNRMRILKQVRRTWIDGLLMPSLHHAATIELRLQDRPDVLENPWQAQTLKLDRKPHNLPIGTSIIQVYDEADGELLILGEPGAGKTTLLLELANSLLKRADKDEQLPMPIVFHLSSWANKRQSLSTWLVEELRTKYQVSHKIAQGWIDSDQVLPLLDGLDEVTEEARSSCVQAINAYYQSRLEEHGYSPIVVCCRSDEYGAISTRIILQHAVSILPLTPEQINTYLEQIGEQTQGLRQGLNEAIELYSVVRQPLMLNILTFAYQGAQASEVPIGATREEMQHTVFARYVECMLKRRGQSKRWKPEQIISWLTFLAMQMRGHNQTLFSVENLQPTWLSRKWRLLYQCCVGLVSALIFGLLFGLSFGLFVGLLFGLSFGLFVGLLFGLFVGLVLGLAEMLVKLSGRQLPGRVSRISHEGVWYSGKRALLVGLLFGLIFGLLFGPIFGLIFGLVVGLLAGLVRGPNAFVRHFLLRFLLSQQGNLPRNLVAFLDEAVGWLLLRKVGRSYFFLHRLLQDYFAALGEKDGLHR